MTWQDNFQVWTKRNDLPEYLKNEMDALAKDDQQAEDLSTIIIWNCRYAWPARGRN